MIDIKQYRIRAVWILVAATMSSAVAQTRIDLRTQAKSADFSNATSTKPSKSGIALPATCSVGETFLKTDAIPGANLYVCTAANLWTVQANGITSLNGLGGSSQSFVNDTNVTVSSTGSSHKIGWTGLLGVDRGGINADLSATGGPHQVLKQSSVGAAVTVGQLAANEISGLAASALTDTTNASNITSGMLPAARLPNPGASTLGGVQSKDCGTGHLQKINTDGTVTLAADSGGHAQDTDSGTTSSTFQVGTGGPKLKNNSGVLEARNAADDDYADVKFKSVTTTGTGPSAETQQAAMTSGPTTSGQTYYQTRTSDGLPEWWPYGAIQSIVPEDRANKDTSTSLGASDTKYPTQKAVKTYVDAVAGTKAASNASTTVNSQSCALGSTCTVTADPASAKFKTVRVLGYELVGTGTSGVLQAADFTAAGAASINDGNAKTLTEASCISDTGTQTIVVSVGGVARFTMNCVVAGSYTRTSNSTGTNGYIVAADMATGGGNTAIAAGAVLNITGTANGSTKDLKVFAYGTVN